MKRRQWRGMRVPYITSWTAESVPQPPVIRIFGRGGEGIGYADEEPLVDRRHEALWARSSIAPGRGEPVFHRVNSRRQQRAMRYSLCQVCGEAAIGWRADERTLHLLGGDTPIAEGETTTAPPVHPACAVEATENCPPLRRGHAAALVEFSPLWGVAGIVHDPVTLAPLPNSGPRLNELQHVHIGAKQIRWTLASFTVVSLHGVTRVFPDELHAMAAEAAPRATTDPERESLGDRPLYAAALRSGTAPTPSARDEAKPLPAGRATSDNGALSAPRRPPLGTPVAERGTPARRGDDGPTCSLSCEDTPPPHRVPTTVSLTAQGIDS